MLNQAGARRKPVIFCDFDGTITETDNIVAIMQHFKPPGWEPIMRQTVDRKLSIRAGVGRMFALIPCSRKQEILRFVLDSATIRRGFERLLEVCRERQIDFYVTSGGIDFFVHPILSRFDLPPDRIYCNGSDFSGDRIRITWPHPCDELCDNDCGMCKARIIRSFDRTRYCRVLIGDSLTDFAAAKLADLVFARSRLIDQCKLTGQPFIPFDDFTDIVNALDQEVSFS